MSWLLLAHSLYLVQAATFSISFKTNLFRCLLVVSFPLHANSTQFTTTPVYANASRYQHSHCVHVFLFATARILLTLFIAFVSDQPELFTC
jgi:hypothetical protein